MVKLKKILFLITNLSHGGAERVLVNLANNLDKNKYEVTVKTIFDVGINKQYLLPHVNYSTFFSKTFHGIKFVTKFIPAKILHRIFVKGKYDIEIAYLEGPPAKIISGTETKKFAWIHIELQTKKAFSEGFFNKKDAIEAYKSFDRIVCVSNTVSDAFKRISGIKENLVVKYNTNESEIINTLAHENVEDVDFNPNEINVCSVAKIEYSKGYDRLVEIHDRLIKMGIKHHVYIIGAGGAKESLENKVKEKGLEKTFTFLGFKENPYKYVAKCDLYVCSSRREGFSTAVTEALILGVPCISTNCSGAYELLGMNNEYGVVTDNNEIALEEGIKLLLKDKTLLEKYRRKAFERGKEFSTKKTVREIEKMIDELVNVPE